MNEALRNRIAAFVAALLIAATSIAVAAEPNGMTAVRLLMYRIDPGILGIVPLQSHMKADLAFAGSADPWPKLARYMESGDRADLPPPVKSGSMPPEITKLPFYTNTRGASPYVLPSGGPVDQVILGAGFATLTEIGEHPIFMTLPDVQVYLRGVFSRLDRDGPPQLDRDALLKMSALMVGVDSSNVTHELEQQIQALGAKLMVTQPPRPFFVGDVAEQCTYNAFALQDPKADALMRGYLSNGQDVWDLHTPDGGSWRKELGAIPTGDWPDIYKSCRVFIESILLTPAAR